jgi:hypothetical protein
MVKGLETPGIWGERCEDLSEGYQASDDQPVDHPSLSAPLALRITQGSANLCHCSAALISHVWSGGRVPTGQNETLLHRPDGSWISIAHTRFLVAQYQGILPYDRAGVESANIARFVIAYEALHYGYHPNGFPKLMVHWTPDAENPLLSLRGLNALTSRTVAVYDSGSGSATAYLQSRSTREGYSPTLLWCTGDGTGSNYLDQDPHVYSVLAGFSDGAIVRDARAASLARIREGIPVGFRDGRFALDPTPEERTFGLFFLPTNWLVSRFGPNQIPDTGFLWFMGGAE